MDGFGQPRIPCYAQDFYSDAFIVDPLPHYAAMRALGPVVFLPALGNYAITRYEEVKQALRHFEVFSSAQGVAADQVGCDFLRGVHGNTLNSDPPQHDVMRAVVAAPLLPGALESIRGRIEAEADALIGRLLSRDSFDGMADLARHLPLTIVTELVGLAEDGRENMLHWAGAAFDILGVQNERGRCGMQTMMEMRRYIATEAVPERLKPGSWTGRLYELVDRGQIPRDMVPLLVRDYISPSLDTTISATGELFYQLARNPAQWDRIRRDPMLIPGAVNEAVRLGSPVRSFSRTLTRPFEIGGAMLPEGARVMVLYASANRDKRRFPDPDRFDPSRPGGHHIGFGHGIHQCVGMHLARLEMESLLRAMVGRVSAIEIGEPTMAMNNTIHAFATLPMRLQPGPAALEPAPVLPVPVRAGASPTWYDFRVAERQVQAEGIVSFDLVPADGAKLPLFKAGAHVDIEVSPGLVRQYSLCNDPATSAAGYRIAVLREETSRGGSKTLHDVLREGMLIRVSTPRNTFPLDEIAGRRVVLVAGGIGITPMLSMAYRLKALGADFTLHYCVRTAGKAAFLPEMERAGLGPHLRLHFGDGASQQRFSIATALGAPESHTDIYCCGPARLMDALSSEATALGWPDAQLHLERFATTTRENDVPFTLVARRSGVTLTVDAERTILETLEAAGIQAPSSCCAGVCATCLTDVLCGVPDHRDMVLTSDEKAANQRIAICCSRSRSRTLVLDI